MRMSLFSVVAALTAALVLSSVRVYADDTPKCPKKDAVCKSATKTVVVKPYDPKFKMAPADAGPAVESPKPAPVPEKPTREASAEPAPVPAPEKKEPAAAGALITKIKPTAEQPEVKPAPAETPKSDEPKGSTPATPKKPEEPAEPKGGDDELVSIHPNDVTAGAEAAMNHGFQAGYTKGHADGVAVATKKKYRIMSREEVIKLSLDAAQKAIERRLGPSPEKKAP